MVATLGLATIAVTRFQRDVFADTTSHFEDEVGALARVNREVLAAEIPLGGVLYELGRSGDLKGQWHQFQEHGRNIEAGLAELRNMTHASTSETLIQAEELWRRVAREVEAAKALWGTGVVGEALAKGQDPYAATVWAPLTETQQVLAEALAEAVHELRSRAALADRRQAMVQPIVLAVVASALALSLLSGWRLSRRVVGPLSSLRVAAARMRDGNLTEPVTIARTASSEVTELAGTMNEMAAALSHTQGRLRDQAYIDVLTGLPNRKALGEFVDRAFSTAADHQLAVLLVDVDDFKFVNDSMGHAAGDAVLQAVAGRLRAATRNDDMVARLGGDEFAVVIQAHDAPSTAAVVAERILSALHDVVVIDGNAVRVGCSIGVAIGAPQSAGPEEVVRNADIAMYVAKSRGKNCFDVFDATMHASMLSRIELKRDLGRAVEDDELELHYQPIVDLESDALLGFEALVRWRHRSRGLLPPAEFLDLAEETGDIVPIGGWVIERACRDLARFQAASGERRHLWMAVNLSARQVVSGDLSDVVHASLTRHGIDAASLILEITEQALMTDTGRACQVLAQLRDEGVMVALDDFGTGFSSLRSLQELPVDVLKIDRSFISGAGAGNDRSVILDAIVAMGRGLGVKIVAEGIEHEHDLVRLRRLGPMAGQGYLIARPMSAARAAELAGAGVSAQWSYHCA